MTGSPTPEVKWSKVGESLPAHSVEDGELKLFNATQKGAGQFKCEATNSVGFDDAETSVQVIQFVKPPEVLNTTEGGKITAKCHVTTEPKLQHVEWSKANNGSARKHEGPSLLAAFPDGTLKLTELQEKNAGTYVCTVSVGNLKLAAKMQLNVLGERFSTL